MDGALNNVKVLDFTQAYAGATCTLILRELGADVLKVERVDGGDTTRTQPPITEGGEGCNFVALNRGKKGITLNLSSPRGREIALKFAEWADVAMENFRPGVMDRLGLGYADLKKVNPKIIYVSVCGFGHTGPRTMEPGYDVIAQVSGGISCIEGFPHDSPAICGIPIGDYLAPLYATIAILAALNYRTLTGVGQAIDISQQDAVWNLVGIQQGAHYFYTGKTPRRFGNTIPTQCPFGIYPAKDGHVVICVATVGQWELLVKTMGRHDLVGDERYVTSNARVARREEVDAIMKEWTEVRTKQEIYDIMKAAALPCTVVPTFEEVTTDPQLLSRNMVVEIEQVLSGKMRMPGSVFKMSETPGNVAFPAPFLGQHNYEVYSRMLGLNEAQIKELQDEGVI
ncbi:MAG: CoA transferase [Chloroflexi bacterium]|nr:CoA transferase [Chloroflexota bacterium]